MKFREPEHGFGCINALNIVAMLAQCEAQPPAPTAQLKNVRWASAEEAQVKGGIAFAAGFKFSQQIMWSCPRLTGHRAIVIELA
jgi:hypothetical protein